MLLKTKHNSRLLTIIWILATTSVLAQGKITTVKIDAPQLGGERKIWIYTPEGYENTSKRYPVLYMHDAQNLFDPKTSFAGEWNVDETLDSLKAKVIVVGIENGGEKRLAELTPFPNVKYGGGKAHIYLSFLLNNVKKYVDKNYRTKRRARHTMIGGSSLGGLTSLFALVKHPDIFGKAMVFSPSLWYSDDIYKLVGEQPKIKGKIYLLAGDAESAEMVPQLERMFLVLKGKVSSENQIKKEIVRDGQHNEKLWRQSFAKAYLWLIQK